MSQYNKLSNIQYARFQILHVDLHFGLYWSAGIPTMHMCVVGLETMWCREYIPAVLQEVG